MPTYVRCLAGVPTISPWLIGYINLPLNLLLADFTIDGCTHVPPIPVSARLQNTIGMVSPGVPIRCALSISDDGFLLLSGESSNLAAARAGLDLFCRSARNLGGKAKACCLLDCSEITGISKAGISKRGISKLGISKLGMPISIHLHRTVAENSSYKLS